MRAFLPGIFSNEFLNLMIVRWIGYNFVVFVVTGQEPQTSSGAGKQHEVFRAGSSNNNLALHWLKSQLKIRETIQMDVFL